MKVAIGIPVLNSVPGESFGSILKASVEASKFGEVRIIEALDLVPYDRARNFLLDEAIKQGCDLFWAIDSDCVLPDGAFEKLFKTLKEKSAQAVLAHNYMRGYPYVCSWFRQVSDRIDRVSAGSGVHQISSGALHCCLIDLKWVEKNLEKPYFKYSPSEDEEVRIMEDAYFFDKIGKAGGVVLGHGDVRVGHVYTRVVICDKTADFLRSMQRELVEGMEAPSEKTLKGMR